VRLLLNVIESYRFDLEIEELAEMVRALDILGAERRLIEYQAVLYTKWNKCELDQKGWEQRCGERLPVSFFDHVKKYDDFGNYSRIIGSVGSQRLIEYFLSRDDSSACRSNIFISLCSEGLFSTAQWLYHNFEVDIHAWGDEAFQRVCGFSHCPMVI
jgi:hypothetical protein